MTGLRSTACRLATAAALVAMSWSVAVAAIGGPAPEAAGVRVPLPPRDDAARDPEFFGFRARLQAAVARHDAAAVEQALHPQVKLSFGGDGGLEGFRRLWRPEAPDSALWATLAEVLALGGRFGDDGSFTAPYVFTDFPPDADAYDHVAVIGRDLRLRAAPSADAPVVGAASFEVLPTDPRAPRAEGWAALRVDGRRVWIDERFVRSPIDYRVRFARHDGAWRIEFFLAGD